jgi:hypothetical protein
MAFGLGLDAANGRLQLCPCHLLEKSCRSCAQGRRTTAIDFVWINNRTPPPVPVVYVIVRMCAMSAVISTFPLSLILLECGWPFSSGRGVALVLLRSESGEGHERLSSALESQVVFRSA